MKWTARRMRLILNLYPPYLGAGVRVMHLDPDWRELHVSMRLTWYNRNVVGTHFGGSLYSMVDPHLMLLLMGALGPDYVVWDKAASIDFEKPGKGRVHAVVQLTDAVLDSIRQQTAGGAAFRPQFAIDIRDDAGDVVATVSKVLHVRRRKAAG